MKRLAIATALVAASCAAPTEPAPEWSGSTRPYRDLPNIPRRTIPAELPEQYALPPRPKKPRPSRAKPARSSVPPPVADGDLLDRLANCESGMDRYAIGAGKYHSYFQWLPATWRAVSGLPGLPEDYDYATQKAAAARIPVSAWRTQFPGCARKLGV